MRTARTPVLDIAHEESGPADGRPVVLMHGFPDDIHAYDGVAPPLAVSGYRVIVPYLRGYGPTRFLEPATPRSGQQAALGHDLLDLIDALALKSPRTRSLPATIEAGERPASSRRCGRGGSAASSRSVVTTSRTSRPRVTQRRPDIPHDTAWPTRTV
jgi:hypothetical protein